MPRGCGIDARLVLPAAKRRQEWPLGKHEQVREADYVLVMPFRLLAAGGGCAAATRAAGCTVEAALIREELYRECTAGMRIVLVGQVCWGKTSPSVTSSNGGLVV